MKKTWLVAAALTAVAFAAAGMPAVANAVEAPSVGVIVSFENTRTAPAAAKLISAVDGTGARPLVPDQGVYVFSSPYYLSDSEYAIDLMMQSDAVTIAEPNYLRHTMTYAAPTDPGYADTSTYATYYSKSWALRSINADKAWQLGQGDTYPLRGTVNDVKIGCIDTGAYLSHPDLNTGNVIAGYDYLDSFTFDSSGTLLLNTDTDVTPVSTSADQYAAHGSATAALMGGAINGIGTAGDAWNPTVYVYKVEGMYTGATFTDAYGNTWTNGKAYILASQVIAAIYGAADDGCRVVNISLGGYGYSPAEQNSVNYAWNKGAVIVAAAGNDGVSYPSYPASYANVVSVAALGNSGGSPTRSSFSNYGVNIDLSAPGENVWTVSDQSGWGYWNGTSFSSPLTAGAMAYVWRAMPGLSNAQIVTLFEAMARPVGGQTGWTQTTGFGETDAGAAYNALILPPAGINVPSLTNQSNVPVSWTAAPSPGATYTVSLDGAPLTTTTTTGAVAPCADGTHTVQVVSSAPNRFESTATATFAVDTTPPSVSGFAYAAAAVTWSVTDVHPVTMQAAIDSTASPTVVSAYSVDVSGLSTGTHTLYVRAVDSAGNSSDWVAYGFTVNAPDAPVAASSTTTDALSSTATWSSVASATAYEFSSDGGATITTTTATSAEMPLVEGANEFQVRSVDVHDIRSVWATGTITDVGVTPGQPALTCPATSDSYRVALSWTAGADALRYAYRVDSGAVTTSTGLSADLVLTSQGAHTVWVRSENNLRASEWTTATVAYTVPAPVVASTTVTDALAGTASWSAVGLADHYEFSADNSATVSSTTGTSLTLPLAEGDNDFEVRTVLDNGDRSAWSAAVITNVAVVPETPAPSCPATCAANHVTVSWPAAADALHYEYHVDSAAVASTTALSVDVALGAQGEHTIYVRSRNNLRASAWATATVVYGIAPTTLSAPGHVWVPQVRVSWTAMPDATGYEYQLNGNTASATTETSAALSGLVIGANTVWVRVIQGADKGDWTPATVTYATPTLGLSSSPGAVAYRSGVSLYVSANFPSRVATIQTSPDGVNWSDSAAATIGADGVASLGFVSSRSCYLRAVVASDELLPVMASNLTHVDVRPIVGGLKAPSRVGRGHRFGAYGYITPAAARGGKVTLVLYRKVGSRWVRVSTVTCKVTSAGASIKYAASIRLTRTGYWKLVPRYQRTAAYADATGPAKIIRVR